ncbi:MAG: nucleotidyltransferase domain-containing protein [Desulfovibrio sp.]|nr:nucleotidyltransferase domain-containing protein [Desulfovibrio sp.]
MYVGSYGSETAIDESDIDILVELPESEYTRYDYTNREWAVAPLTSSEKRDTNCLSSKRC